MKKLFVVIFVTTLSTSATAFDFGNIVSTTEEWRLEQTELSRMRRQFVGIGVGPLITLDGTGVSPMLETNLGPLWADYYVGHGGSVFLGGRVSRNRSHTEVIPFAVGVSVWHAQPLWAPPLDRIYDVSIKVGITVRVLRFVEVGVFVRSSLPDPSVIADGAEDLVDEFDGGESYDIDGAIDNAVDNTTSLKDSIIDALIPRLSITIRGVADLKKSK
jgi:hypothetical protein